MITPGGDFYTWIKALHVIAVISWMAGILYLPRLFVYHVDAPKGSEQSETFKLMERRLYYAIMTPAMVVSLFTGFWMAVPWLSEGWMHAKLLGVAIIFGAHMMYGRWRRKFAGDENVYSSRFFRFMNEVPTLAMILIVIMVIVKPF